MIDDFNNDFDIDSILAEYGSETQKDEKPLTSYAPLFEEPVRPVEPPKPIEPPKPVEPPRPVAPPRPIEPPRKKTKKPLPPDDFDEDDDYDDEEDDIDLLEDSFPVIEVKPKKTRLTLVHRFAAMLFLAASLFSLWWIGTNLHPDIGISEVMRTSAKMDLMSRFDAFTNNAKSDALGDLAYIRKIFKIDPSAPCAPKPDERRFATYKIEDAAQVMELVQKAQDSGLLDGQDVIFTPNADFYWDSDIRCYCDDTILVICWKEKIDGRVCSCVEIKIADASQFRRKLTGDSFGSSVEQYTTQMSASVNAITAMNADYYAKRNYGVVVYQGEIYRYQTAVDTLFIDDNGDFSFLHRYEDPGRDTLQQQLRDNHVNFSVAFGPILIENGEVKHLSDNYGGLGEMNMEYSRAGIGQYDTLHYLYMTVSHSNEGTPRCTVNQFADIIATKNLKQAYNLDGGQTGEVVFNHSPYNHIDFGNERLVSDCIYFGTAIPETEVTE